MLPDLTTIQHHNTPLPYFRVLMSEDEHSEPTSSLTYPTTYKTSAQDEPLIVKLTSQQRHTFGMTQVADTTFKHTSTPEHEKSLLQHETASNTIYPNLPTQENANTNPCTTSPEAFHKSESQVNPSTPSLQPYISQIGRGRSILFQYLAQQKQQQPGINQEKDCTSPSTATPQCNNVQVNSSGPNVTNETGAESKLQQDQIMIPPPLQFTRGRGQLHFQNYLHQQQKSNSIIKSFGPPIPLGAGRGHAHCLYNNNTRTSTQNGTIAVPSAPMSSAISSTTINEIPTSTSTSPK